MAQDGEDDLGAGGGQGLDVVQLVVAAFLQRHDAAGGVGGVDLGAGAGGGREGPRAGGVVVRAGGGQGLAGALDLAVLVDRGDGAGAAGVSDSLPGGGLARPVLQPVRGRFLPLGDGGFFLADPAGEHRDRAAGLVVPRRARRAPPGQ